jgi:anti-anti-sigma factor
VTTPSNNNDYVVDLRTGADEIVVQRTGELDLSTAPKMHTDLIDAFRRRPKRVVVDLRSVTFVDSSALGVVVNGNNRASKNGCEFVVHIPVQRNARFPFEVTGLANRFATATGDTEALAV